MRKVRIIDLSIPLEHNSLTDPEPYRPKIRYIDHREGAVHMQQLLGVDPKDLVYSAGLGWSIEEITAITHTGTHLDAPWHYHPMSEGKLAKTIDQIPLEWCYSDGVVLDFRHKKPGEYITVEDVKEALDKIKYTIKPYDIVLIMTGRDKYAGTRSTSSSPGCRGRPRSGSSSKASRSWGSTHIRSTGPSSTWPRTTGEPRTGGLYGLRTLQA